ncbi:hypothetical protein AB0F18_38545 [Streptomyces sp. NPDC029216]|uniref:hypothetical protein n=1 Tax=Streptomyces sp. NPDC029216 TaxID=3154701 RepID=UPI0033C64864
MPDPRAEADLWDLHADLGERLIRESEREAELLHPKIDYPREIARDRERATALRAAANRANTHDPAHASADATEDTAR